MVPIPPGAGQPAVTAANSEEASANPAKAITASNDSTIRAMFRCLMVFRGEDRYTVQFGNPGTPDRIFRLLLCPDQHLRYWPV